MIWNTSLTGLYTITHDGVASLAMLHSCCHITSRKTYMETPEAVTCKDPTLVLKGSPVQVCAESLTKRADRNHLASGDMRA